MPAFVPCFKIKGEGIDKLLENMNGPLYLMLNNSTHTAFFFFIAGASPDPHYQILDVLVLDRCDLLARRGYAGRRAATIFFPTNQIGDIFLGHVQR